MAWLRCAGHTVAGGGGHNFYVVDMYVLSASCEEQKVLRWFGVLFLGGCGGLGGGGESCVCIDRFAGGLKEECV